MLEFVGVSLDVINKPKEVGVEDLMMIVIEI
jgi:hypothetical protein